jgi:hypothetical protein
MIISRLVNAIKRTEAVKQRGEHHLRMVRRTRVLQASAAQEWQMEPLGVAHPVPLLEIVPNKLPGGSRAGTRQFVTAPREADETSSAYLAITPDV